jgi:hypothetical protein
MRLLRRALVPLVALALLIGSAVPAAARSEREVIYGLEQMSAETVERSWLSEDGVLHMWISRTGDVIDTATHLPFATVTVDEKMHLQLDESYVIAGGTISMKADWRLADEDTTCRGTGSAKVFPSAKPPFFFEFEGTSVVQCSDGSKLHGEFRGPEGPGPYPGGFWFYHTLERHYPQGS